MERDAPRVFALAAVGMGVLLALLAVHLRIAIVAGGPVAVPDVPAYLGIAQWVGGDGLALGHIPFQPGYGLVIAPLVAVAQVSLLDTQGEVVHYLALVVNSLAAAAAVVVAGRLGLVGSRRWWVAGAAGLIAAVHPSLSAASRIAWPETLLTLFVLVAALAVAFAVLHAGSAASRRAWARAGLFATLAVALHARMIVLVVAVVATALLCRIGRRAWAALGVGLAAGGTATAVALTLTDTWPTERLSEAAQLDRGAEPIATVSGQLLALGGGTAGLGLIGLVAGLGAAIWLARNRSAGIPDPLTAALLCLALGAIGAVMLGGWTLTGSARADALLYGRYVDPWAVPLVAVTLAQLASRRRSRPNASSLLGASAAVAVIACAVVVGSAGGYDAAPRRIMTLSFSPAWNLFDERLGAVAVVALVVALLGMVLAAVALRGRAPVDHGEIVASAPAPTSGAATDAARVDAASVPGVAMGALVTVVLVLGAVATVSNHRHLADVGAVARDQVVAAGTVADAVDDGLTCLAHDRASVPEYALWLYRLELPEIDHERVELDYGDRLCSELVVAHDDLAQRCTNARHLVDEPAASWALWHLPERTCVSALNMEARTAGVASHDGSHDSGIRSG